MKSFLSSTYVDLVEHRRAATDALERLGQSVGRMEVFGARPNEPTDACLVEIEESDLFVGIYAHRYGYIPYGSEISITETEFDYAKEHGKPIFCFLIDDNHPWPPTMIENDLGGSKLAAFKQKMASVLVLDTFTTPVDLAYKVAAAVGRYLAGGNASVTTDVVIPPLVAPFTNAPTSNSLSSSPLRLRHIIEGTALDSANRIFDLIIANPSGEQVLLTGFDVQWHYHHGMLSSIAEGVPLRPVAKYVAELPIDPDDDSEKRTTEVLYPPVAVPPVNESGPSLTTLRLQLHYYFAGRIDWHPCSDWDIIFSLGVRDESERLLPIFSGMSWRSRGIKRFRL